MTSWASLPSVFVCKLLGYLDWRSKLSAVVAVPHWTDSLRSTEAWPFFANSYRDPTDSMDDIPPSAQNFSHLSLPLSAEKLINDDSDIRDCIKNYGRYFQKCKLILEFEDVYMCHMDQTQLYLVLKYCSSLRTLIVHFPRGLGFKILECLSDYRELLNKIPTMCARIKNICIHFIDYTPVMERLGISELFHLEDLAGVASRITAFDFSYIYSNNQPQALFLKTFTHLRTLQTDAHLLNYETIVSLCENGLRDLHLISNALTRDYSHPVTGMDIDWTRVAERFQNLRVYYIYECTSLLPWSLNPNPLLYSLVFDSLNGSTTHFLLEAVGRCFGKSLRVFAQISNEWSFMPYDYDIDTESTYSSRLLANCPKLEAFYTSLIISSSDIMAMADSGQLKTLVVNKDEIFYDLDYVQDPRTYLDKRMTLVLGDGWTCLPKEVFPEYTRFLTHLDDDRVFCY